jgi:anti-sigma B factor antagonist
MFWMCVRTCGDHGCAVIELHGELDLAAAAAECGPLKAVAASESVTILDLSEVDFMDCSGLRVLIRARQHAGQFGHELILAAPPPMVSKILQVTGVNRQLPTYISVAAAADAVRVPDSAAEHVRDSKSGPPVRWKSACARLARDCVVTSPGQCSE